MKNEIEILLPAFNEEQNVSTIVQTWQQLQHILKDEYGLILKIIVVNDGSSDKTAQICNRLCEQYDNCTLINHPKNKGLGEAVKTALLYVAQDCPNCKFACIMDCDNTQEPRYIVRMLDKIGAKKTAVDVDVVIASRYRKGSRVQGVAGYRLLTSEGAKYVYRAIIPVKNVRDYTCGYRLYTVDIIRKCYRNYGEKIIEETGFTCMAELLYKMHIIGARFAEVPFVLRYDYKQGKSKMKVVKTARNSIRLAFRLKKLKKNGR